MTACMAAPVQKNVPEKPKQGNAVLPGKIIVKDNSYEGIPVEVTGIPYEYADICGSHAIDYIIEYQYGKGERFFSNFIPLNFRFNKFAYDFKQDGSLDFITYYSYDKTPAEGTSFYPAADNKSSVWHLTPQHHTHLGRDCSLDRYDDIAISQAKLNEMRSDPALDKIYEILLSVATDMDYNYPAVGRRARFVTPAPLVGVCDDYAALLIGRLQGAGIAGVSNIVKISGQNHAWVTLTYQGRLLYLDATWFDKNIIGDDGVVSHTPYKDPRNMTFDNDIFTNHGKHHVPG
jgi:hypothetical protein